MERSYFYWKYWYLEQNHDQLNLRFGHPYYYQLITLTNIFDLPWIDMCVIEMKICICNDSQYCSCKHIL